MHDILTAPVECPCCGKTEVREITFSANVGPYSSQNDTFRIGQRIRGFPPIRLFEAQGYVDFRCCVADLDKRPEYAVIQIVLGELVKMIYPQPPGWDWAELPRGRHTTRREQVSAEKYRREFEKWRATRSRLTKAVPMLAAIESLVGSPEGVERMAFAMAYPLRHSLDYSGLFEECVRDASWPESYFRDEKTGAWKRRRSRRLW